eukprot:g46976.t1
MDRLCQVKEAGIRGWVGRGKGWGDFETRKIHVLAIGLLALEVEYEVLLLQFAGGIIVTLEEAQDGHVTEGVGGGVKMVGDWKVLSFVTCRAHVLYKVVSEPPLDLTDVEEATSGAVDAVDQIHRCAGEPLSNVEGLFCALNR